ncbi:hypothetical protein SIN8267_02709 [Sinobacterium norvegicum]|uniref:Uncharacterized protein n=1 Tax=Sinobacterium norvegicum TaxID=1641715 RepID=A0ABN8EQM7_9GAMM|nr:hypothetical protein [Sinobacterium norvegicum]CAH0992576.1 hypothetical protein SIN8267_02709 [Sinobacterium norvegicum]
MSLGSWDPKADEQRKNIAIENQHIELFVANGCNDNVEDIAASLNEHQRQTLIGLCELSVHDWQQAAASLSNTELWYIIRFWTAAEYTIDSWDCAEKSPVIAINKLLKKRKAPLNKDQLQWIKNNSRNQFIPNGPLLF